MVDEKRRRGVPSRSASPCGLGRVWSTCHSVPQNCTDRPGYPAQYAQLEVAVQMSAVFNEQPEQFGPLRYRQGLERRALIRVEIRIGTFAKEDLGELEFVFRARPVVILLTGAG